MSLTRVPKQHDGVVGAIGAVPDVVRVTGHPGQVLLYPRHTPTGLYLVISGAVRRDGNRVMDAARGAFLVPALDDIEKPAPAGYTVARDAEMFFIPRSLALHHAGIRRLLEKAGLASRPATV
jgi:hypothetical protein